MLGGWNEVTRDEAECNQQKIHENGHGMPFLWRRSTSEVEGLYCRKASEKLKAHVQHMGKV